MMMMKTMMVMVMTKRLEMIKVILHGSYMMVMIKILAMNMMLLMMMMIMMIKCNFKMGMSVKRSNAQPRREVPGREF